MDVRVNGVNGAARPDTLSLKGGFALACPYAPVS